MSKLFMQCMIAALAPLSATLAAQDNDTVDNCPHMTIERVAGSIRALNTVTCGSGVEMNIGGVRYSSPPGTCTLLIIYTPEHWIPSSQPGCNTYAQPAGFVREHIFRFACRTVRFLWIIPIDGECTELDPGNGDSLPNYAVYPCRG